MRTVKTCANCIGTPIKEGENPVKDYFNELSKLMDNLGRKNDLSTVFNDFLTLSICAYHRTNIQSRLAEKDEENEALYLKTIKRYDKEEVNTLSQMLAPVQLQVYQAPYSDILGEYFTQKITMGQNGQYFTPEPICQLMTAIHQPETIQRKSVQDPACGSGRMLLAFAKASPDNYFFGADNNNTCAKMATVNFFLNGLRGEVSWMNTLTMEWYGGWHINTKGIGIVPIKQQDSLIWKEAKATPTDKPPAPEEKISIKDGVQLDLF